MTQTATKSIVVTAIATFAVLFMLFAYGIGLFAFFFPRSMIGFMQRLGNHQSAAMMAHRAYISNPNQANRIRALDTFIDANRYNRTTISLINSAFEFAGEGNFEIGRHKMHPRFSHLYARTRMNLGQNNYAVIFVTSSLEFIDITHPCLLYFTVTSFDTLSPEQRILLRTYLINYFNDFQHELDWHLNFGDLTQNDEVYIIARGFISFVHAYLN
ncbi:MAG: hypothetical protein FWE01_00065 [Firmicutes bacterium]|nr:hypothetical protein [Bacillota bacterium]